MSVTADSKRLAFNKWSFHFTSYVADLAASGTHILTPRHFTLSESSDMPADWTSDSKAIIVVSNRTGRFGIYKQALNEDTAEPLVTGADSVGNPRVSPDGKWVLYFLHTEREPEPIMRVPITGGPSQLVLAARHGSQILRARPPSNLCAIAEPTDDRKLLIISALDPLKGRGPELTRFALDPKEDGWRLDLSPDGTRIAASRSPGGPIYILSLRGHATQIIKGKSWSNLQWMNWAADGKGLFVTDRLPGGTAAVRYVDLQGNAHVLWENGGGNFTEGLPSPDGRHLAIMGLTVDGNMWMLENF
jgi:Tol biopolymer transport system component